MSAPKLKAYQVSEMRRHYQNGESPATIAVWFDCSESAARYHIRDIRRSKARPRRNLPETVVAQIRAEWQAGIRAPDIAKSCGVAVGSVYYHCRGLPHPIGGARKVDDRRVADMRRRGIENARIARALGVNRSTIHRAIKRLELVA